MIIPQITRSLLNLLYNHFAVLYDLVAYSVSFGKWSEWRLSAIQFLHGENILELGFGTGHLLKYFADKKQQSFGIDASVQMAKIAGRRLRETKMEAEDKWNKSVVVAKTQNIPFCSAYFDTVIATFPTHYIFDPRTLAGIFRVLKPTGMLIILLSVYPHKNSSSGRILSFLYKITGQSMDNDHTFDQNVNTHLISNQFSCEIIWLNSERANLKIIRASPLQKT